MAVSVVTLSSRRDAAYVFYVGLEIRAGNVFKDGPTLLAADFNVSIDGGAFAALTTLPTVTPAAGVSVKISLSAAEMTGDKIVVACIDAADNEWNDVFIFIEGTTPTFQFDKRNINQP